ncbi:MAG: arsenate reductase ArsC [Deltaproteobacteria bacterium]|nr:arsenate reductase ArsC [Deltaproteobacteria bacterium]
MRPQVLFICLGNSCRSIMAEALARHRFGNRLGAASAGLRPLGFVTRETLEVLAEVGAPTGGLYSKGLGEVNLPAYRLLVNLSDYSLASRIPPSLQNRLLQRPVLDPYGGPLESYRQARDTIRRLVLEEIAPMLLLRAVR